MKSCSLLAIIVCAMAIPAELAAQTSKPVVSARITRLEAWLTALATHRHRLMDEAAVAVNKWNQEELRQIWIDVTTLVSLVREPGVTLFYISEPSRSTVPARPVSPVASSRATQVMYLVSELRHLREIAKAIGSKGPGHENDVLKRGAMLHTDIAMLAPAGSGQGADGFRPGPGGYTLFMSDGQQIGFQNSVSHWAMGRRLLDRVRPVDSKKPLSTTPDPGGDDTVRLWYVASSAYMLKTRFTEPAHFERALELFPDDPDVLFAAASVHELFAGVRVQAALRSMNVPRDVTFDVGSEAAELRRAEQLYKRALERNPTMVEARIRLGRVLGLRGRHQEAIGQLRQAQPVGEGLLRYYMHLFLGATYEALGNGREARRSYEQAIAVAPLAQSAWLGLSRAADRVGDRAAAREAIERVFELPDDERERADPWWVYEVAQGRHVDQLFEDLRRRF